MSPLGDPDRETIRQLVSSITCFLPSCAWTILSRWEQQEQEARHSTAVAQKETLSHLKTLVLFTPGKTMLPFPPPCPTAHHSRRPPFSTRTVPFERRKRGEINLRLRCPVISSWYSRGSLDVVRRLQGMLASIKRYRLYHHLRVGRLSTLHTVSISIMRQLLSPERGWFQYLFMVRPTSLFSCNLSALRAEKQSTFRPTAPVDSFSRHGTELQIHDGTRKDRRYSASAVPRCVAQIQAGYRCFLLPRPLRLPGFPTRAPSYSCRRTEGLRTTVRRRSLVSPLHRNLHLLAQAAIVVEERYWVTGALDTKSNGSMCFRQRLHLLLSRRS